MVNTSSGTRPSHSTILRFPPHCFPSDGLDLHVIVDLRGSRVRSFSTSAAAPFRGHLRKCIYIRISVRMPIPTTVHPGIVSYLVSRRLACLLALLRHSSLEGYGTPPCLLRAPACVLAAAAARPTARTAPLHSRGARLVVLTALLATGSGRSREFLCPTLVHCALPFPRDLASVGTSRVFIVIP